MPTGNRLPSIFFLETEPMMNRAPLLLMASLAVFANACFAGSNAVEQSASLLAKSNPNHAGPAQLISTSFSYSAQVIPMLQGDNDIDSVRIDCPVADGCIYEIEAMVEAKLAPGTQWSICPAVDNALVYPKCPYQGTLPSTGSYITGNGRGFLPLPQGSHKAHVVVTVDQPTASAGYWQITYRLYQAIPPAANGQ